MKDRVITYCRFIKDLFVHFIRDFSTYFYRGWKSGLMGAYAYSFVCSLIFHLNQFRIYLYAGGGEHHHIREEKIQRLQRTALGLHALLPQENCFSYSILIAVRKPRLSLFQETLDSALNQSAPHLEILIGLMEPLSEELKKGVENRIKSNQHTLSIIECFFAQNKEEAIQHLAQQATGRFLLILGEEDWLRPDLFLRYEQTLRLFCDPDKRVLYCNLNRISDKGYFIPNSEHCQPHRLFFPFFFKPFAEQGWLIPAQLWRESGGLDGKNQGAEYERLLLQCDLAGACFQHIPLNLYSIRSSRQQEGKKSQEVLLHVLNDYSKSKQLDWRWSPGYQKNGVRAIPPLPSHRIQVVIPYKDQKELTLKCLRSVMRQKDVEFSITVVDNGSADSSIGQEIKAFGAEVMVANEPFNYSRLNNLAVKKSEMAADCRVILFLNNDVELQPDALCEMLRWIDQPGVGMVGCRLHYPDGRLQHGGVEINPYGREEICWEHIEKLRRFEEMDVTKQLGFFDAVTGACAMIKRNIFLEVGGFDEVWYPIGYSDTYLAVKLALKGLRCFYTPYAVGIHHESVSRKSSIEDYENSWWLHHLLMNNPQCKGYFPQRFN
ncbi:MAG: glycosyltransferase family 2 protein [Parachlamydiaceae bacterium]